MTRRPVPALTVTLLLAAGASHNAASSRFDTRLTPDRQIVQALNRLTFGARPGDVDEVRKIGVEKWIEQQLHPDQIPENPVLEAKLQPFESLHMTSAEILQKYFQQNRMAMKMSPASTLDLPTPEQRRKVYNGTAEERTAAILALDHGHGSLMMVLGVPVGGGKVYGRWPGLQKEQLYEGRDLDVTTDFRAVLGELGSGHLGQKDIAQVFPGFKPGEQLGLLRA